MYVGRHGGLLINLCNTAPVAYRNQIVTHHDIGYVRYPESYSRSFRYFYRTAPRFFHRKSRSVLTVSEFSKTELTSYYGIDRQRILVVPNAAGDEFRPATGSHLAQDHGPSLLAVSSPSHHKNFARLVDAFDAASLPGTARLRIIGQSSVTLRRSGVGTRPNVEYLGRVSETQLVNEYQEATAFVLPSLYEGFGLPAIEAQKCGCPVIASDAAAVPETLRESAYYFDPLSTAEISRSIERVLLDRDLQSRLITLGARECKQVLVEGLGTASRSPYN
jgi:glycosyltransferase involved in cell wall biosynthesis